jgi:tetratricopeptide (TPR) repeat protein
MFIACEYVSPDGLGRNSLTHYLKEPFSLARTLTWAIQFCDGMEYACSRGVTPHRDVKPDNIMITVDGDVKITDFGLVGLWSKAEGIDEIRDALNKNQEGLTFLTRHNDRIVAGSPPWMAPEQFYGIAKPSSDIYGLGIVLFQLVNFGELPWKPRKGDSWAIVHKNYPIPQVPHRGAALEQIIRKCLEKRRDKRYQDFADLRSDFVEVFRREITRRTGEEPPDPPELEDLGDTELVNKGMTLANLGLVDEGIRQYREGLKKDPRNAPAHYNLGNALAQKGFLGEAVIEYREAIKIDPDMTAARFNLGIALFRQGRTDEAIREYREVLRLHPESPDVYVNLGVAFHKRGLLNDAIKAYREAVRIRPSFAEAHYKLGISLFGSDLLDEAIAAFSKAVRIRPSFAEAHNNLGTALMKKGLADEAIGAYGRAVANNAGYAEAYYNLGLAFVKRNLPREAVQAFEECVRCAEPRSARSERARSMATDLRNRLGLHEGGAARL